MLSDVDMNTGCLTTLSYLCLKKTQKYAMASLHGKYQTYIKQQHPIMVVKGMGSRQFCQGRGRGQGRKVEAEARQGSNVVNRGEARQRQRQRTRGRGEAE